MLAHRGHLGQHYDTVRRAGRIIIRLDPIMQNLIPTFSQIVHRRTTYATIRSSELLAETLHI